MNHSFSTITSTIKSEILSLVLELSIHSYRQGTLIFRHIFNSKFFSKIELSILNPFEIDFSGVNETIKFSTTTLSIKLEMLSLVLYSTIALK